jgi:hypothetical protein
MPSPNGPLRHLRFSGDGQYILAQDESRVTVLTVQPFAVLFRVPADSASLAQFSPDSQDVLFVSSVTHADPGELKLARSAPHVERWNIAERKRLEFSEIRSQPCATLKLSPDGHILGCVDFAGTLRFINVASGDTMFEKKGLCRPFVSWGPDETGMFTRRESGDLGSAGIEFSPDGRFALASHGGFAARSAMFGWDAVARRAMRTRGELARPYSAGSFVFVAADRVLLLGVRRPQDGVYTGTVVTFPSGRVLSNPGLPAALWTPPLPGSGMYLAAESDFLIFRLCGGCPAAALEYRTGQMITTQTPVLDVLGKHYVAERANGELGLYERGKPAPVATVRLDAP